MSKSCLRIGFDAKRLFFNNTGLGNYSRTLIKNLQRFYPEHEYYLFSPKKPDDGLGSFFLGHPGFKIIYPKKPNSSWRSWGIYKDINEVDLDIYHGLSHELPFSIGRTKALTCLTIHDLIFEKFPEQYGLFDRYAYKIKYRWSARKADKIVAISKCTQNDIRTEWHISENKIVVIYQACANIYYLNAPPRSSSSKRFLYIGSINQRKQLAAIIEAISLLKDKSIIVDVIGEGGWYEKKVKALVHKKNLQSQINFLGNLKNEDLPSYYKLASGLIYPSMYEGFGIPVAEAGLSACPVIINPNSALPEVGREFAMYLSSQSPKAIADAIKQTINFPEELEQKAKMHRDFLLDMLDPADLSEKLINIYHHLCTTAKA